MKIAATIARVLLGLLFFASGLSVFLALVFPIHFPPPPPGMAGDFQKVYFGSHWVYFVDFIQLVCGALLLSNRYVPLALVMLAAVLYNILVVHITIMPQGLPFAIIIIALWSVVVKQHWASLAPLTVAKPVE